MLVVGNVFGVKSPYPSLWHYLAEEFFFSLNSTLANTVALKNVFFWIETSQLLLKGDMKF